MILTNLQVKWRRSQSTDAFRAGRSDSIISMITKGYGEIRDGVRTWTKRAYSLRPGSRPPPSPQLTHLEVRTGFSTFFWAINKNFVKKRTVVCPESLTPSTFKIITNCLQRMNDSVTVSTMSRVSTADSISRPNGMWVDRGKHRHVITINLYESMN